MENLGIVGIKSVFGRYLQARTDGEMHSSNPHRNEEETWFLFQVDVQSNIYALQNWRTGNFLTKLTGTTCTRAHTPALGPAQQWTMISGEDYGVLNAVAFKSAADGTILGALQPDHDSECGGEVGRP